MAIFFAIGLEVRRELSAGDWRHTGPYDAITLAAELRSPAGDGDPAR